MSKECDKLKDLTSIHNHFEIFDMYNLSLKSI